MPRLDVQAYLFRIFCSACCPRWRYGVCQELAQLRHSSPKHTHFDCRRDRAVSRRNLLRRTDLRGGACQEPARVLLALAQEQPTGADRLVLGTAGRASGALADTGLQRVGRALPCHQRRLRAQVPLAVPPACRAFAVAHSEGTARRQHSLVPTPSLPERAATQGHLCPHTHTYLSMAETDQGRRVGDFSGWMVKSAPKVSQSHATMGTRNSTASLIAATPAI